jgi:hypothetical protein
MEGLDQKFERITNDVNSITELYDYAEKLLPYDQIREPVKVILIVFLTKSFSLTKMSREETLSRWLLMAMEPTI